MFKLRFVICVITTLVVSSGCSKKADSGSAGLSSISFSLPSNFGNGSLAGTACFAVNIKAGDIETESPGQCDSQYGVVAGLTPLGGIVQMKAPRGSSRTIEIFYIISGEGCSPFDPKVGLGEKFGSNNVYRVSQVTANFDKPVVEVVVPMEYPTSQNSLKSLLGTPASCDKAGVSVLSSQIQVRPVVGEYRGTTNGPGGRKIHVRVTDKQIELESPSAPGQLRPLRLGVSQ